MGTTVTSSGVSVQFCDRDGNIDGPPVFSTFVRLLGQPRDDVFARTGVAETPEEHNAPGSADWLTLIAIADSQDRLDAIVQASQLPVTNGQTSASSRRVDVRLHIGALNQTFQGRITIASGVVVKPPILNVFHIKVLGEGAAMNPQHKLFGEFQAQAPFPQ